MNWPVTLAAELSAQHGVQLVLHRSGDVVVLSKLVVPHRSRGVGTTVMAAICCAADEHGDTVALTPTTDFGASSTARLVRFYRRFGFVPNQGRNRDFTTRESMIRTARPV